MVNVVNVVTELMVGVSARVAQGQVSKWEHVILIEFLNSVVHQGTAGEP